MPETSQRITTGVAGLDDVLHGGLIASRLYLIEGNPGAGKTTLAQQFLLDGIRRGERCLYITLSETEEELREGARSHGWNLDGIDIVELIDTDADVSEEGELTLFHPSEVELGEATRRIFRAIEATEPQRLVFDSL